MNIKYTSINLFIRRSKKKTEIVKSNISDI